MGNFVRTDAKMDQLGFVRGPAMIYAAPITQAPPTDIGTIIRLTGSEVDEIQTVTTTGVPTGGTFKLNFRGVSTIAIPWNAAAAVMQAALEGLATIGAGNVTCAGGPLPTGVVVTFTNNQGKTNQPLMTVTSELLTGGATPHAVVAETTPGVGLYDPMGSWFALGGTKDGVNPTYNSSDEEFTIDQQQAIIGALPQNHEWTLTTSLVQVTLENLAFAWDMGPVTLNTTPAVPEKRMGMGAPSALTQRRIAVIHRRGIGANAGLLRCHFFRIAQRQGGTAAQLAYAATGEQQRAPLNMRALVDDAVQDEYSRIGYLLDQQPN